MLVGPAGTGKGVVIDMAARAEKHAGHHTIGVAVSGSTAERLGETTPALAGRTSTIDALIARAEAGTARIGPNTTVFLDEAGMADHRRLDALTRLIDESGAKLVAVGDGKQLPSIGPGGMFDRLTAHARSAELADIHRTSDPEERQAWAALRRGEPEKAMAHYQAEGQLFFMDDREQAGEAAVQRWAELTKKRPIRSVALIADSSNVEIDRLNARAQHLRAERGELGQRELPLPHQHYGLREGDLITFTAQHRQPGQLRVENGTRAEVTKIGENNNLDIDAGRVWPRAAARRQRPGERPSRLRPARLPPARRNRRPVRRADRRMADQQGERLRPSNPGAGRDRVVPRPRRARHRRPGRPARHAPRTTTPHQPPANTIPRPPRARGPRLGTRIPPHTPAHPVPAPRARQSSPAPRQTARPRRARTRAMSAQPRETRRPEPAGRLRLTATDVMTVSEVSDLLHVPVSTIADWGRRGLLPSVKIGRRRLYIRPKIEAQLLEDADAQRLQ